MSKSKKGMSKAVAKHLGKKLHGPGKKARRAPMRTMKQGRKEKVSAARACTCCRKSGHTVATCRAPGAQRVRELLKILRLRGGQRRKKSRYGVKKSGSHALEAMKKYTVKQTRANLQKSAKTVSAWGKDGRKDAGSSS